MALPRSLKNFNLYNDGFSYLGEVEEVNLPKLKRKMEDYRGGGMSGPVKIDHGMEGIELDWTAGGWMHTVLDQWGATSHDAVQLRFAGAIQGDDIIPVSALEIVVRGRHEEIDPGSSKAGDKTQIKIKTTCSYYKLTLDGETKIEIDLVNGIEIVNGNDMTQLQRLAMGMI